MMILSSTLTVRPSARVAADSTAPLYSLRSTVMGTKARTIRIRKYRRSNRPRYTEPNGEI